MKKKWVPLTYMTSRETSPERYAIEFTYKKRTLGRTKKQEHLSYGRAAHLTKVVAGVINDNMDRINQEMKEWVDVRKR